MFQINFIGYLRHKEYTCISPVHLPVHPIIFLFYQEELPSTWPSMTHLLSYLALLTPESGTVPEFPSPCDEKIMSMCQMEKNCFLLFLCFLSVDNYLKPSCGQLVQDIDIPFDLGLGCPFKQDLPMKTFTPSSRDKLNLLNMLFILLNERPQRF